MLGLADGHNDHWVSIEANISRGQPLDWGFLLEHYSSTLDLPSAAFYKQLLKANPHAKVILTVRDPAAIHRSAQGTWCRLIGVGSVIDWLVSVVYSVRPYGRRFFRMQVAMGRAAGRTLEWEDFSWPQVCANDTYAIEFYEAWNAEVRAILICFNQDGSWLSPSPVLSTLGAPVRA